jgi:acylphosphatase
VKKSIHLVIYGRVQGVGFRDAMCGQAKHGGVFGWVRNRMDGTVEALAHGDGDAVDRLVAWARHGPRHATVARVEIQESSEAFADFQIKPTRRDRQE